MRPDTMTMHTVILLLDIMIGFGVCQLLLHLLRRRRPRHFERRFTIAQARSIASGILAAIDANPTATVIDLVLIDERRRP